MEEADDGESESESEHVTTENTEDTEENLSFVSSESFSVLSVPVSPDFQMNDKDDRHHERMQRKKAVIDRRIAEADARKGVLLVNTGIGKGKSSAAFGVVARALGNGLSASP